MKLLHCWNRIFWCWCIWIHFKICETDNQTRVWLTCLNCLPPSYFLLLCAALSPQVHQMTSCLTAFSWPEFPVWCLWLHSEKKKTGTSNLHFKTFKGEKRRVLIQRDLTERAALEETSTHRSHNIRSSRIVRRSEVCEELCDWDFEKYYIFYFKCGLKLEEHNSTPYIFQIVK